MANLFLAFLGIYFLVGLLFGLWFVNKGAGQIDEGAAAAGWGLKLLWLPGSMALWPVLLRRILQKNK